MCNLKGMCVALGCITLLATLSGCNVSTVKSSESPLPSDMTEDSPVPQDSLESPVVQVTAPPVDLPNPNDMETVNPLPAEDIQKKVVGLPEAEKVDLAAEPMLYDFVYGLLDWHVDVHRNDFFADVCVARHDSSPSIVYIDWYVVQEGFDLPPRGSKIERYEMSDEQLVQFDEAVKGLPQERIIREGDWEFYLLNESGLKEDKAYSFYTWDEDSETLNNIWGGLCYDDLEIFQDYSTGLEPPFITDGTGWPRDWLLREPYYSRLKQREDDPVDMKDSWWDTWNLEGKYSMVPAEGEDVLEGPYVICTGAETFTYGDSTGFEENNLTWYEIRERCNQMGYDIPGRYTHGEWEP